MSEFEVAIKIAGKLDKSLQTSVSSAQKMLGSLGKGGLSSALTGIGNVMESTGKALTTGVTMPVIALGATSVKEFGSVDKSMKLVQATMGSTDAQAKQLESTMKKAAANSVFGMQDAADATLNFARQGFNAKQAGDMLTPALNLAAGTATDLSVVTGGLGNALKMFGKHAKYVLKLDVRKCYPTMNHEELRKKLQRRIKDKKFLRLADRIIASFQQPMATHERLLPETDAVGIPVGLFTSPWFCNFFFQDIDHKVAEKTGAAHNVRYVDDMVLFDSSKRRLHKALEFIEAEVKATKQTVKDNWQVFILSKRPLDFLGFKFHPNKTTIRKSIMLRISRKARTIARAAYASIRNAHAMVSYIGYIVNSDSQRFYEKWVRPFVNIKHLKGVIADEDRKQHQACVAV